MTSSIFSPRRLFALCSPSTQVMASATLLLPQPLGPTMAVTPWSKASSDRSEKDLKPEISRRSRRIAVPCPYEEIHDDTHGPSPHMQRPAESISAVSFTDLTLPGAEELRWESSSRVSPFKRRPV